MLTTNMIACESTAQGGFYINWANIVFLMELKGRIAFLSSHTVASHTGVFREIVFHPWEK